MTRSLDRQNLVILVDEPMFRQIQQGNVMTSMAQARSHDPESATTPIKRRCTEGFWAPRPFVLIDQKCLPLSSPLFVEHIALFAFSGLHVI